MSYLSRQLFCSWERPGTRSTVGLMLVLALSLVMIGCGDNASDSDIKAEVARNVRVLELAPETLVEFFEVSGSVKPALGTDLSVEESGPVVALPIEKGQPVAAGDLLIELDRTILKAEMESAVSQLAMQEFNIDKVRKLYDAKKLSQVDLLTAEAQYSQAKSLATISKQRYRRAGLTAPFAGILTDRYVEMGQLVLPGQAAVRLIDPHTLELEAHLTASEVGWVRVGDDAQVRLGQETESVIGTIAWVALEADLQTGKFKVEITIPNDDLSHHAGVIGRARLPKQSIRGAVVIPRDAVMPSRVGFNAFVVEGDRAVRREIQLGADQGSLVVVKSGLQAGDLLVVRGHRELRDNNLVHITETATSADGSIEDDPDKIRTAMEVGR